MDFRPHAYQQHCIDAILEHTSLALWLEMGLGKTVITLTALERLLYDTFEVNKALIIAPKRVAEATWQDEAERWNHTQHLRISTILGTAAQRARAAEADADIYIVNRENTKWLVDHFGRAWPYDTVVIDEATSFKSHKAQRFKALKSVRPHIHRVIELTGTPQPRDPLDLWAQVYLLDQGERLGRYFSHYRQDWFVPDKRNATQVFSWKPAPGAEAQIRDALRDICISLRAADHLELPELITDDIPVKLDAKAEETYRRMEQQYLLEVDGETVTAQQAAALTNKLLQLCNGSVYDATHTAHEVHACKLEAFSELIEALDGQKALVFYAFEFDAASLSAELEKSHKGLKMAFLRGPEEARAWNNGEIDVLLAQPASCAYGLNLQHGGHHVIWYSLPWSLEYYAQANARLYRQGQKQPVIVHRLLVKGGEDERVAAALERKDTTQAALMEAIKARVKRAKEAVK